MAMKTKKEQKPYSHYDPSELYKDGSQPSEIDFDIYLEDFMSDLDSLISEINPKGYWSCTVTNFGWRNEEGEALVVAKKGKELLRAILPNTDCTFKIYKEHKKLRINNFHHDSPMGAEWYELNVISEKKYFSLLNKKVKNKIKDRQGVIL